MKQFLLACCLILFGTHAWCNDTLRVCSPSGTICVKVWIEKELRYCVYKNGNPIVLPSDAGLVVRGKESFSGSNPIKSSSIQKISDHIVSPVPEKRKIIKDEYNRLSIKFSRPYQIEFRAYDDGVAYRFLTSFKDSIVVEKEIARFRFPNKSSVYFPGIHKRDDADIFHTSYEELFTLREMEQIRDSELAFNPVLVALEGGGKVGITESGLEDYPGMFLAGTGANELDGLFAPYPLEENMTAGE